MLDFQRSTRNKPVLTPKGQRKLLYAILVCGLPVLFLARELSKPAPFAWVAAVLTPTPIAPQVKAQVDEGAAIDTRRRPAPAVAQVEGVIPIEPPPPEIEGVEPGKYFPGVDPQTLAAIQDGTPHRGAEREAYAHLIETLAEHQDAELWKFVKGSDAEGPLAFSLLFRQPNHYRGRLVHIQAKVRGCVPYLGSKRIAEELAVRMKTVPTGPADPLVEALAKADFGAALLAREALVKQLEAESFDVIAKEALSKHLGQIQDQLQIISDVQKSNQDRLKKERDEAFSAGKADEAGTLAADLQEASKRGQLTQRLAETAHRLRECARLLLTGTKAEAVAELQGLRGPFVDLISRNYYHLWLETTEGQLVQAYVLELPPGFPVSKVDEQRKFEQFAEPVDLIGFFFKLLPYQAQDDARNAPLVFARTVVWTPPPPPPEAAAITWQLVLIVLLGGGVIGVLGAYLLTKGDAFIRPRSERSPPTAADLAGLARMESLAQAAATEPATNQEGESSAASVPPAVTPAEPAPNGHPPAARAGDAPASEGVEGTSHP